MTVRRPGLWLEKASERNRLVSRAVVSIGQGKPVASIAQLLDRDVAEHHGISVTGEPEIAALIAFAWMCRVTHVVGDLAEIRIEDQRAI